MSLSFVSRASYPFVRSDAGRSASRRPKQKNDCTVRAVTLVYGIPYDDAYDRLKSAGRKSHQGYHFNEWAALDSTIDGKKLVWQSFPGVKGQKRMNPLRFCKDFPEGRFIVRTAGHVFAIIDGVGYDDEDPERDDRCIYGCWKLVDA